MKHDSNPDSSNRDLEGDPALPGGSNRNLEGDPTSRNDLARVAAAQRDAVWGTPNEKRPGKRKGLPLVARVFTGEIGPKGEVGSELRKMRAGQRDEHIPRGTVIKGGGFLIFLAMVVIVAVAAGMLALLYWLVS